MKTITVSPRAKTVNELLKRARRGTVILETADGQRFALAPISEWQGFEVGSSLDFAREVERTGKNKKLMHLLAARQAGKGKNIPLAEVKRQLGLA